MVTTVKYIWRKSAMKIKITKNNENNKILKYKRLYIIMARIFCYLE